MLKLATNSVSADVVDNNINYALDRKILLWGVAKNIDLLRD